MISLLGAALAAALLPGAVVALDNPLLVKLNGAPEAAGTASFYQNGDRVIVNVDFENLKLEGAAVAIVEGSCSRPGGTAVELTDTINGQSQTQVPGASVAALVRRPHALVVRRSEHPGAATLSCGNIKG